MTGASERAEVAVVGGGLAGAAAAAWLARAGVDALLLERDRAPGAKVCGEFLSAEGCREVEALGLDLDGLGALPIRRLRLCRGSRAVELPLPFAARSVPRAALDPALRARAAEMGARLRMGARVTGAGRGALRLAGGAEVRADRVLLASGKIDLGGHARAVAGGRPHLGFAMRLRASPAVMARAEGTVALAFFRGGYVGLVPSGPDALNISAAVSWEAWRAAGKDLTRLLATNRGLLGEIGAALDADPGAPRSAVAIGRVPYGHGAWAAAFDPHWLWRAGDQAAVVPSLSGSGMTMALRSGRLAAEHMAGGRARSCYLARIEAEFARPMRLAGLAERLLCHPPADALAFALALAAPSLVARVARATRVAA